MTTKLIYEEIQYSELTVAQAAQVCNEYPAHTDPWLYEYDVDQTGRVVDRYRINPVHRPAPDEHLEGAYEERYEVGE